MQGKSLVLLVVGDVIPWREDFYHEFTWTAEGKMVPSQGIRSAR